MLGRIPEPHELADAYYARLDEERARELARGTCGTCAKFRHAPSEWAYSPFGWCCENEGWFLADEPAAECEDEYEEAA